MCIYQKLIPIVLYQVMVIYTQMDSECGVQLRHTREQVAMETDELAC